MDTVSLWKKRCASLLATLMLLSLVGFLEVSAVATQNVASAADFHQAVNQAKSGDTVRVTGRMRMLEDIHVDSAVTLFGTAQMNVANHVFYLDKAGASITADGILDVYSALDGYRVTQEGDKYALVEISAPKLQAPVAGSRVETNDGQHYLFLDLDPEQGMTLDSLRENISMQDLSSYTVKAEVSGNDGTELVKTSDRLVVSAYDRGGRCAAQITYIVIVMGDINCNGKVNSSDTTIMKKMNFGEEHNLEIRLAADTNCSGSVKTPKINSSDAAYILNKWLTWETGKYVSNLK